MANTIRVGKIENDYSDIEIEASDNGDIFIGVIGEDCGIKITKENQVMFMMIFNEACQLAGNKKEIVKKLRQMEEEAFYQILDEKYGKDE